jgi:hypothetical protein
MFSEQIFIISVSMEPRTSHFDLRGALLTGRINLGPTLNSIWEARRIQQPLCPLLI